MTLKLTDELYFSSIGWHGTHNDFWVETYNNTGPGGKFAIDLSRKMNPNRFVTRDRSIWTTPWPQTVIPKYAMAQYDSSFTMNFSDVCDACALEYKQRINEHDHKFAIMYSGGIDSTIIVTAFLKNLTTEELKNVAIATSVPAIVENPIFWNKYINGRLTVIDSIKNKYDTLIEQGYYPITGDDGDCIFGTVFGLNLYHSWETIADKNNFSAESKAHIKSIIGRFNDPDVHYSEFKDLLIAYFALPPDQIFPVAGLSNPNPQYGQLMYDKYDLNASTSDVPVRSLHDFFWWLIFNVKMLNCGVRGALYYNDRIDPHTAIHRIENWYSNRLFQLWSMNNNNNGQKIGNSAATYKQAGRDYIYDFDRNPWYKNFKLKLESMAIVTQRQHVDDNSPLGRPASRFGITKEYEMLDLNRPDVKDYIRHHLSNFKIDWSDATYEV